MDINSARSRESFLLGVKNHVENLLDTSREIADGRHGGDPADLYGLVTDEILALRGLYGLTGWGEVERV